MFNRLIGSQTRGVGVGVRYSQRFLSFPQALLKHRGSMSDATPSNGAIGPIETAMRQKLTDQLKPTALNITNDSHLHRHHSAMQAIGGGSGETHFSVHLVSDQFIGKPTIARHRLVYEILDQELVQNRAGIHALSLKTMTPEEYQAAT